MISKILSRILINVWLLAIIAVLLPAILTFTGLMMGLTYLTERKDPIPQRRRKAAAIGLSR